MEMWPSSFRLRAESIGIPNPESRMSQLGQLEMQPAFDETKELFNICLTLKHLEALKPCFRQIELTTIDPSLQTFLMGGL